MQGFNRRVEPDYDPREHSTLNARHGIKALGKRDRRDDLGHMVVRFELPFKIVCNSCSTYLGAGIRYNAQKRKVGNYYSTPIYAFRCKCHVCQAWFELRTDPKNARYIVEEGARQVEDEWDPSKEGGFEIFDTDAPSASEPPTDAFAHLEKNQHQRLTLLSKSERLTDLSRLSDRAGADPYTVSRALRARAREERRKDRERELADEAVRERYGLDSGLKLVAVDEVGAEEEVKEAWNSKRRSHRAVEIPQDKESLASTLVETTKRKAIQAIFDDATAAAPSASSTRKMMAATLGVRKGGENQRRREDRSNGRALGIVAGYGSSSGDDEG